MRIWHPLTHANPSAGSEISGGHGGSAGLAAEADANGCAGTDAIEDAADADGSGGGGLSTQMSLDAGEGLVTFAGGAGTFAGGSHASAKIDSNNPRQTTLVALIASPHRLQCVDHFPKRSPITSRQSRCTARQSRGQCLYVLVSSNEILGRRLIGPRNVIEQ